MTLRSKTISNRLRGVIQERIDAVLDFCTSSLVSHHQVHRLRVAILRMRPALQVADKLLGTDFNLLLGRDLRWLHKKLGALRDWDVLMDGEQDLIKEPHETKLQIERVKELRKTTKALGSPRIIQLQKELTSLRALLRTASSIKAREQSPAKAYEHTLQNFINASLDSRFEKLQKSLRKQSLMTTKRLHCIRKKIKKLRYTLELFEIVFPDGIAAEDLEILKSAQNALGRDHDMVSKAQLIRSEKISQSLLNDAGLKSPQQHVKHLQGRRLRKINAHLSELQRIKSFWNYKSAFANPNKVGRHIGPTLCALRPVMVDATVLAHS